MGLELLKPVCGGVVAVRPAAHTQLVIVAFERDLGFIAWTAAARYRRMTFHSFPAGRRRSEAKIEVAHLGREFAQRADGDGVLHVRPASGTTLHTATSIPRDAQKPSQRIWLACSRSPGPFTSMRR